MTSLNFSIPASHPALPGHFPGRPIVPGAVILDTVISRIQNHIPFQITGVRKSKFLQILLADETVLIEFKEAKCFNPDESDTEKQDWRLRYRCTKAHDDSLLTEGNLSLTPDAGPQATA